MQKIKIMKRIFFLSIIGFVFFGCQPEPTYTKYGCMDPEATNYDPLANYNDGCKYNQTEFELICISDEWPDAPYPNPDDTTTYVHDCYLSIEYIYYCLNGKYVSMEYFKLECCEEWEEREYITGGLCY